MKSDLTQPTGRRGSTSCFDGKFHPCDFAANTGDHKFKRDCASCRETLLPFPAADADNASLLVVRGSRYPDLARRLILTLGKDHSTNLSAAAVSIDLYKRAVYRRR